MGRGLLLGIDAGQTVTKAVLFDESGHAVGGGSASVRTTSPRPRWVERDMAEVWNACAAAIRGALKNADVNGADIAAVGICGHGDGLYPIDADGVPVRPAITAMDSRAWEIVAQWRRDGRLDTLLPITGQAPFPGSPAGLYSWLRTNEPENWRRTKWSLFCKDWLRFQLTGEVATDRTEASASFTDVHAQKYSQRALETFGLADATDRLPPIVDSAEVVGAIRPSAADETGLAAGTPVVAGAHDVDAAALGMGAVTPGDTSIIMGTFSINQVISEHVSTDARWQARSFLRPGQWLNMATSPASSTNLDWFVRILMRPEPGRESAAYETAVTEAAEAARAADDSADPVVFLPFLYGSPHGPDIAAAFTGVRGWHDRGHLILALLEGVVFNHRTHLDALREAFTMAPVARLGGGGAKSRFWADLLAAGTGFTVEVTDTDEPGARGAALLAGVGIGRYDSIGAAADAAVRVVRRHPPTPAGTARLERRWATYQETVTALDPAKQGRPEQSRPE